MDDPRTALTAVGLGLDYNETRLARTSQAWLDAGADLGARVAELLGGSATEVAVVGSTSVLGLLAKPIIDLAVGVPAAELRADQPIAGVTRRLQSDGWIYRGDAGCDGGHVFVLESRPWYRVAHLHVVDHQGDQWRNYLRLRDLLWSSPEARRRYEAVKTRLAADDQIDRRAYTSGKTEVVSSLLQETSDLGR